MEALTVKNIGKYILIGLGASFICYVWTELIFPALFGSIFSYGDALILGTGTFLSFEMVVLAGIILSKQKDR